MTDWRAVRRLVPEVLGALVRRYGHFDACEDAVQEALLDAAAQWPVEGWPANPRGWLVTVASRRLADQLRRDTARRRREDVDAARTPSPPAGGDAALDRDARDPAGDDTLTLRGGREPRSHRERFSLELGRDRMRGVQRVVSAGFDRR